MRILFVNKFLHPNGGSETYIFRLGECLAAHGHEVQYFGMEHEGRCVGNRVGAYTQDMDFHGGSMLGKITYPLKTIYSAEARRKLRLVLDDFQPDVVHLNNFTYQLTPSVILETVKWRKETGCSCRIVFTAHDYNLICPNHMLNNPNTGENCERCLGGHFVNCAKGRCIHGSLAKSAVGSAEGYYWKLRGTYRYIDAVICCSQFMKRKMDTNPLFAWKTIAMHNFVDRPDVVSTSTLGNNIEATCSFVTEQHTTSPSDPVFNNISSGSCASRMDSTPMGQEGCAAPSVAEADRNGTATSAELPERYVLYFGRYAKEKGIVTLLKVCRELPQVHFLFAGKGPLEEEVNQCHNITNVGFQSGEALLRLIRNAYISVYPSEWYENCPFSVMESQIYGTPVLGADIGGIPELIRPGETGELFRSGDAGDLKAHIQKLWDAPETVARYREGCRDVRFDTMEEYCEKLLRIYRGDTYL